MSAATLSDSLADAVPLTRITIPGNPHPATRTRWWKDGILVNGVRVKLRAWRRGSRVVTTASAVEEFLQALNSDENRQIEAAANESTRRADAAADALRALGG